MKETVKAIVFIATVSLFSFPSISGQAIDDKLQNGEEQEAKKLVTTFFDRYQQTRDLTPLFREFFVSDFPRRLEHCRKTDDCEGFARDFWKNSAYLNKFRPTQNDYLKHYAATINVMYLGALTMNHLARKAGKVPADYVETAEKEINKRLSYLMKKDAKSFIYDVFEEGGDNSLGDLKSRRDLRNRIAELETLAKALRVVEEEVRTELQRSTTSSPVPILGTMSVSDELNTSRFFDYPKGTKIVEVWPDDFTMPFKVDLIKEKSKFRIVAIYPPMD